MLLGVVSDTHGQIDYCLEAIRMLESFAPAAVLHCGDIGSPEIVPLFHRWPTHFVFGNVDYDADSLREAITAAGQTCHDRFGDLALGGVRIALLHSDDEQKFREACDSGRYDLVCYGHTHVAKQERRGRTLILNPGALYRAPRHTIALVDLPTLTANIVDVRG